LLKIGSLNIEEPLILAPMAGVTDWAFRLTCRKSGCPLAFTEMISAVGLTRGTKRTHAYLFHTPEDQPLGIQLFGADPSVMAEAARIAAENGADLIDINMGCPVKKVVKTGAGAALLKDLSLVKAIIGQVRKAIRLPLTIKMRAGWRKESLCAEEVARIAEGEGVDAITIHARTADQGYRGQADWTIIEKLKSAVKIPVIGNGDIRRAPDVAKMLKDTGCDAVMIGRAALGYPWIFREARAILKGNALPAPPVREERIGLIKHHLFLVTERWGEEKGILIFRKHLLWYTKGLPGGSQWRQKLSQVTRRSEIDDLLRRQIIT